MGRRRIFSRANISPNMFFFFFWWLLVFVRRPNDGQRECTINEFPKHLNSTAFTRTKVAKLVAIYNTKYILELGKYLNLKEKK